MYTYIIRRCIKQSQSALCWDNEPSMHAESQSIETKKEVLDIKIISRLKIKKLAKWLG